MMDEEMLGDGDLDLDEDEDKDKQIEEKKISSVWLAKSRILKQTCISLHYIYSV